MMTPAKAAKRRKHLGVDSCCKPTPQRVGALACCALLVCFVVAFTSHHPHTYGTNALLHRDGAINGGGGESSIEPLDPLGYLVNASFSSSLTTSPPQFRPSNSTPPLSAYANLPVSHYRPTGQFATPPAQVVGPPVITILTVTYNPRHYIFRVARFVQEQSLQAFRWIIVNDHTDDAVALQRLRVLGDLAARDWRVRIMNNTGPRGGPSAMNFGMRYVRTPYVAILDDDDLWELTTLEKAALVMSWVPSAHAVGFDVMNHGAKEFVWTRGFYNGDENYFFENSLVQGSPLRTSVFDKCKFSTDFSGGAADWDLWMCMASKGMWGLHVPENGTWYQLNPESFRKKRWANLASAANLGDTHARIMQKYAATLGADDERAWPTVLPDAPRNDRHVATASSRSSTASSSSASSHSSSSYYWGAAPFANRVAATAAKRLMIIMTSLQHTATVAEMLRYVHVMAKQGWRATVVLTHHVAADSGTRDAFLQYTHDIFTAPLVAPVDRVPQLINYLVESRRINTIVVAHSQFGYGLLPALATYLPHVRLVDYLPDCNASSHAVAAESTKMDPFLDLTIVPTTQVLACAVEQGKPAHKVVVSRSVPTVDFCKCGLLDEADRQAGQMELLNMQGGGSQDQQLLIVVAPPDHEEVAALLISALASAARASFGAATTVNVTSPPLPRVRIFWPGAPLQQMLAADDPVRAAWLAASDSMVSSAADAWALADVAIVVGSQYSYFHPATFGCRGATVLTDAKLAPRDEPVWEWGNGVILRGPKLASNATLPSYVTLIKQAVVAASRRGVTSGRGGGTSAAAAATPSQWFWPGSAAAEQLLNRSQVACPCTDALHRAHDRPPRDAELVKRLVGSQGGAEQAVARALAEQSATWSQLFDMRAIQAKQQYRKSRQGFGRALQRKCPERIYTNELWFDALETVRGCDGATVDARALQQAAMQQCGAGCIANLASSSSSSNPHPYGWSLRWVPTDPCWTAVVKADHECMNHINSTRAARASAA